MEDKKLVGIGGWLALLAVLLGASALRDLSGIVSGLMLMAATKDFDIVPLVHLPVFIAKLWVLFALFRTKRSFRTAFLVMWLLEIAAAAAMWQVLMVFFPLAIVVVGTLIVTGLWYWYVSVSVRVRNTMIN